MMSLSPFCVSLLLNGPARDLERRTGQSVKWRLRKQCAYTVKPALEAIIGNLSKSVSFGQNH